jgi:hypothetical protein
MSRNVLRVTEVKACTFMLDHLAWKIGRQTSTPPQGNLSTLVLHYP